jgi:hypothetical protein
MVDATKKGPKPTPRPLGPALVRRRNAAVVTAGLIACGGASLANEACSSDATTANDGGLPPHAQDADLAPHVDAGVAPHDAGGGPPPHPVDLDSGNDTAEAAPDADLGDG